MQVVRLAVVRLVLDPHSLRLDRDPTLALEVHRVEQLRLHFFRIDRAGELEDPVGERRLAVVDVGDDREVTNLVHGRATSMNIWAVRMTSRSRRGGSLPLWTGFRVEFPDNSEDDGRLLLQHNFGVRPFGPLRLRRIGGLAGFDPIASGDDVVVIPFVHKPPELATIPRLLEASVRPLDPEI